MRGVKISLEGIDGVGKSTQKDPLKKYLEGKGYEVFVKPCRNDIKSADIDNAILTLIKESSKSLRKAPATEVLLQAARMLYVNERLGIEETLSTGAVVLCDRDIDTAMAYAMPDMQRKHEASSTRKLARWILGLYAIEHTMPDLTLWLDAETDTALNRAMSDEMPNERAIFDDNGVAYIKEVREVYRELHAMFPERIKRVDVNNKTADEVSDEIAYTVGVFLNDKENQDGAI